LEKGRGKGEGRIGFFDGREGKEKEALTQKSLFRRKNGGRCWFLNFEKEGLEKVFSSFQNRSFSCKNWPFRGHFYKHFYAAHVCWKKFPSNLRLNVKVVDTLNFI